MRCDVNGRYSVRCSNSFFLYYCIQSHRQVCTTRRLDLLSATSKRGDRDNPFCFYYPKVVPLHNTQWRIRGRYTPPLLAELDCAALVGVVMPSRSPRDNPDPGGGGAAGGGRAARGKETWLTRPEINITLIFIILHLSLVSAREDGVALTAARNRTDR